jgi:hypothetical protein
LGLGPGATTTIVDCTEVWDEDDGVLELEMTELEETEDTVDTGGIWLETDEIELLDELEIEAEPEGAI